MAFSRDASNEERAFVHSTKHNAHRLSACAVTVRLWLAAPREVLGPSLHLSLRDQVRFTIEKVLHAARTELERFGSLPRVTSYSEKECIS